MYVMGEKHVSLRDSCELIKAKYDVNTILTDCGRILGNLLLNQGLIDEISLLIHPVIVGENAYNIFTMVTKKIQLDLLKNKRLEDSYAWLVYKVIYA